MSFQAMAWAVKQQLPARDKLVLLMLANYASNDAGDCYPSVDTLCRDCGMGRTALKSAIGSLAQAGLIAIQARSIEGVNLSNVYRVLMESDGVGRQTTHGVGRQTTEGGVATRPGVGRHATEGGSPNDPKPISEPINQPVKGNQKPGASAPEWLPQTEWAEFVAMRKRIRKPMTDHAMELAIKELGKLRDMGNDPAAVLDQSTMNCWQGLFAIKGGARGSTAFADRIRRSADDFALNGGAA